MKKSPIQKCLDSVGEGYSTERKLELNRVGDRIVRTAKVGGLSKDKLIAAAQEMLDNVNRQLGQLPPISPQTAQAAAEDESVGAARNAEAIRQAAARLKGTEKGPDLGFAKQQPTGKKDLQVEPDTRTEAGMPSPTSFGVPPLVSAMFDAARESAADLRGRISNVEQGPIEGGEVTVTFDLDGVRYKGFLRGRNEEVLLGFGEEQDKGIAARVLLDRDAEPTGTSQQPDDPAPSRKGAGAAGGTEPQSAKGSILAVEPMVVQTPPVPSAEKVPTSPTVETPTESLPADEKPMSGGSGTVRKVVDDGEGVTQRVAGRDNRVLFSPATAPAKEQMMPDEIEQGPDIANVVPEKERGGRWSNRNVVGDQMTGSRVVTNFAIRPKGPVVSLSESWNQALRAQTYLGKFDSQELADAAASQAGALHAVEDQEVDVDAGEEEGHYWAVFADKDAAWDYAEANDTEAPSLPTPQPTSPTVGTPTESLPADEKPMSGDSGTVRGGVKPAPKAKAPTPAPPEYQATLKPNGMVVWQHRQPEELGGGIYDRDYATLVQAMNDVADKFGRRFANTVEKQLKASGKSTNRTKEERYPVTNENRASGREEATAFPATDIGQPDAPVITPAKKKWKPNVGDLVSGIVNGVPVVGKVTRVSGGGTVTAEYGNGKEFVTSNPVPAAQALATAPKYQYTQEQNTAKAARLGLPTTPGVTEDAGALIQNVLVNVSKDTRLSPLTRAIARALRSVNFDGVRLRIKADGRSGAGLYTHENGVGEIMVNLRAVARGQVDSIGVFLHEALHHATMEKLFNPAPGIETEAVDAIKKIVDHVKALAGPDTVFDYELSNPWEFVSALFTRPDFQNYLASVPAPDSPTGIAKFRSALSELFRRLAELVTGQKVQKGSTMEQAIAATMVLFETPQRTGDGAAGAMADRDARFNELTASLPDVMTEADIAAFKRDEPEKYAELEKMREEVLKAGGWDTEGWHGSKSRPTVFDKTFAEREDNWSFSNLRSVADSYRAIELDSQKVWEAYEKSDGREREKLDEEFRDYENEDGEITRESIDDYVNQANGDMPMMWVEPLHKITGLPRSYFHSEDSPGAMIHAFLRLKNPVHRYFNGTADVKRTVTPDGAPDGYIDHGVMDTDTGSYNQYSTVYHVNDPSQIKSADPLAPGPKIPPSQWANPESNDIRYAAPIDPSQSNERPTDIPERVRGAGTQVPQAEGGGNAASVLARLDAGREAAVSAAVAESDWGNYTPEQKTEALNAFIRSVYLAAEHSLRTAFRGVGGILFTRGDEGSASARGIVGAEGRLQLVLTYDNSAGFENGVKGDASARDLFAFAYDTAQEEIIHAADKVAEFRRWVAAGRPGTLNSFSNREALRTFNQINQARIDLQQTDPAAAQKIKDAMLASWEVYHNEPVEGIAGLARRLGEKGKDGFGPSAYLYELRRQLTQLKRQDFTTETGWQKFTRVLKQWLTDAINALRGVQDVFRSGMAGDLIQRQLADLEAAMEGKPLPAKGVRYSMAGEKIQDKTESLLPAVPEEEGGLLPPSTWDSLEKVGYLPGAAEKTQITTTGGTYVRLLGKWAKEGMEVLDYAAGRGFGTEEAKKLGKERGFSVVGYEPFSNPKTRAVAPEYEGPGASKAIPNNSKDVVIVNAVINVVPDATAKEILEDAFSKVKVGGSMFVNVMGWNNIKGRLKNPKTRLVGPREVITERGTFQKGYKPDTLKALIESILPDATLEKTDYGDIGFRVVKNAPDIRYAASATGTPSSKLSESKARAILTKRFGKAGGKFVVGAFNADGDIEWDAKIGDGNITLNLKYLDTEAKLIDKAEHELAHAVFDDPAVQQEWKAISRTLSPAAREKLAARLKGLGYADAVLDEEMLVQTLEEIRRNTPPAAWQRFVKAVRDALLRLFGMDVSQGDAERAAARIVAAGEAALAQGLDPAVAAFGQSAAESAASRRHADLEDKFNAGTITPEETTEAQALVVARAKERGNDTKVFHGTVRKNPKVLSTSFEAGDGIFTSDNPDVSQIFRYEREFGEVITEVYDEENDEYEEVEPGALLELFVNLGKSWNLGEDDVVDPQRFTDDTGYQAKILREAKAKGYDSIVVPDVDEGVGEWTENGTTTILFKPEQLKSADPFTGVPLDRRFDAGSNDIRYSRVNPDAELNKQTNVQFGSEKQRNIRPAAPQQETANKASAIIGEAIAKDPVNGRMNALLRFDSDTKIPGEVRVAGAAMLAEQVEYLNVLNMRAGNASPETTDLADDFVSRAISIVQRLGTESGRTTNFFNALARLTGEGFIRRQMRQHAKGVDEVIRQNFEGDLRSDVEKAFSETPEVPEAEAVKKVRGSLPDTLAKKAIERFNALLDGPVPPGQKNPLSELIAKNIKSPVEGFKEKLIELGVDPEIADALDAVSAKLRAEYTEAARLKAIDKLLAVKTRNKTAKEKLSKVIRTVLEAGNLGALDSQQFMDLFAKEFGLPPMTKEFKAEIKEMVRGINALPKGPARIDAIQALEERLALWEGIKTRDLMMSTVYSNWLSGISTQALGLLYNNLNLLLKSVVTMLANPKSAKAFVKGALGEGLRTGLKEALAALQGKGLYKVSKWGDKRMIDSLGLLSKQGPRGAAQWAAYLASAGTLTRKVFHLMAAVDALSWNTAREGHAYLAAHRALREELAGTNPTVEEFNRKFVEKLGGDTAQIEADLKEARDQLIKAGKTPDLTTIDRMAKQVRDDRRAEAGVDLQSSNRFADRVVVQQEPEGIGRFVNVLITAFQQLLSPLGLPVGQMLIPFNKIVSNLFEQSLDYTPVGIVRGALGGHLTDVVEITKDGIKFREGSKMFDSTERWERAITGTLATSIGFALYALAASMKDEDDEDVPFMVYAFGPTDKNKRSQMPKGWAPFTIKIGDVYYKFAEAPFGMMFAGIGSVLDAIRYEKADNKTATEKITYLMMRAGKGFMTQGVLSSVDTAIDVITGQASGKRLSDIPVSAMKGAIPGQGLLRDLSTLTDDRKIDGSTMKAALLRDIPFVKSYAGRPELNAFGEPVTFDGYPVVRRFVNGVEKNHVADYLGRNDLYIPGMPPTIEVGSYLPKEMKDRLQRRALEVSAMENGMFTPEQNYEFKKRAGQLTKVAVERIMSASPPITNDVQRKKVQSVLNKQIEIARKRAMLEAVPIK